MAPSAAPAPTSAAAVPSELWIPVGGMTCASCQAHVTRALTQVPGVESADVNLVERSARVRFDPTRASPEALVQAVEEAGYDAELVADSGAAAEEEAVERAAQREERSLLVRGAVALPAFITVHLLTPAAAPSLLPTSSSSPGSSPADHAAHAAAAVPPMALLAVSAVVLAFCGGPFFLRAWGGLKTGTTSMSTLVALGTGSAMVWSAVAVLWPEAFLSHGVAPDLYFEAALGIVAFVLLGQNLEARARRAGRKSLRALAALLPKRARIRVDGDDGPEDRDIDAAQLRKGDLLVIRAGERVAADARVIEGASSLDESLLTGEPTPRPRGVGDALVAGSINGSGVLVAKVSSVGKDSTLSRILSLVRHAQSSRAATQALADRISARFVPAVIAAALLTLVGWLVFSGDVARAMSSAIAVVIVACPCAMGLAVPAAVAVAVGRAARLGVLWRDASVIERAAGVDTVVLDKTGTLTFGHPRVASVTVLSGDEAHALSWAAALEVRSEHVLARAVVAEAARRGLRPPAATDVVTVVGGGIGGRVEGHDVLVGSARLLRERGVMLPDQDAASLFVSVDGVAALAIEVADVLRPSSVQGVHELRRHGTRVVMLSGDALPRAQAVARQAGIDEVIADARPEQKLRTIERLMAEGARVAMVGDGVNDAPALARAHVGFAMRSGTDVALEAADVSISSAGVLHVALGLELARATVRVMKQNLFWAFAYNVVAIPLAAGALWPAFHVALSPVVASAAMAASSVSVVANSLRLTLAGRRLAAAVRHHAREDGS